MRTACVRTGEARPGKRLMSDGRILKKSLTRVWRNEAGDERTREEEADVVVCAYCEQELEDYPIPVASEASPDPELVCSASCGERLIRVRSQEFFLQHRRLPFAVRRMVAVANSFRQEARVRTRTQCAQASESDAMRLAFALAQSAQASGRFAN
jgi:hypothetical protein